MSVEQKVKEIIQESLCVDNSDVTSNAKLKDDLGADSLDVVELIMAMEEEFNMEIQDDETETLETVGDVVAFISKKVK